MSRKDNSWKDRLDIVYSTNPDFRYETTGEVPVESLPKEMQKLRLRIEKNGRGGKTVTVVSGFRGPEEELKELARVLKNHCGTGGSQKDSEIIIQGDFKEKLTSKLKSMGYSQTR